MAEMPMDEREQPRRVDGWLMVIFGCTFLTTLLVIAAVLRWPIPWWIYAVAFPLCLLMPLWAAWRHRRLGAGP
jgi:hypothetical protein